ncbi:MAG: ABC transporter permease [Spirochaetaceae bacterium]|nr:MAG: ABC transporter permease [Spirochaetaceae bacterium]
MRSLVAAIWAEGLKVRRSKILWISIAFAAFLDVVMGFLMFVLKNPDFARKYRLIATKASIAGQADWPSFLWMLTQGTAIAGMIGFSFIASWIFGREYSDRTLKDLLALPSSRASIVTAKFVVTGVWCTVLAVLVFALGLTVGTLVGLEEWNSQIIHAGAMTYVSTSVLTILLVSCVAFFASVGRGFLPALGFAVLAVIMAQVITVLGYGPYFPWAVPALHSGAAGPEAARMGTASYLTVYGTSLAGLLGTYSWWRFADQT